MNTEKGKTVTLEKGEIKLMSINKNERYTVIKAHRDKVYTIKNRYNGKRERRTVKMEYDTVICAETIKAFRKRIRGVHYKSQKAKMAIDVLHRGKKGLVIPANVFTVNGLAIADGCKTISADMLYRVAKELCLIPRMVKGIRCFYPANPTGG